MPLFASILGILGAAEVTAAPQSGLPKLTLIKDVLSFGLDTVSQSVISARLEGLVTYSDVAAHTVYIQDQSGGIRVVYTNGDYLPVFGQMVVAEGIAAAGMFAPFVDCASLQVVGAGNIPEPCVAPAARMAAGELFGQWVQVEGVVRDVSKDDGSALLFVSSGGLRFHAIIQPFHDAKLPIDWLDARVALRGVCWPDVDAENKPTGFTLYVPGTNHLFFLNRRREDIFRQPALTRASQPELLRQSDDRLKIVGTVLYHSPGGYVYLQCQDGSVRARLLVPLGRRNPQARYVERPPISLLRRGERIELVGAPTAAPFSPLLQDAEFRRLGTADLPAPQLVSAEEVFAQKLDGRLLSLKARLLATEIRQAGTLKHQVLVLQAGDRLFEALWEFNGTNSLTIPPINSYVRATGICALQAGELNQVRSFRLLVPEPFDLQLLGAPPWWDQVPAGKILGTLVALASVALVWIWLLRRQVSGRTAELQREVLERQRAQTELRHALVAKGS